MSDIEVLQEFVDREDTPAAVVAAFFAVRNALHEIVDRHERPCETHKPPLPDDVALAETYAIARSVLQREEEAA